MSKGRYALNLVPQAWTAKAMAAASRIRLHKRVPGMLPAGYLDRLVSIRFNATLVCQPCAWKYGRVLAKRYGYRRDHEFLYDARCDACADEGRTLFLYIPEENFKATRSTREDRNEERKTSILVVGGQILSADGRRTACR